MVKRIILPPNSKQTLYARPFRRPQHIPKLRNRFREHGPVSSLFPILLRVKLERAVADEVVLVVVRSRGMGSDSQCEETGSDCVVIVAGEGNAGGHGYVVLDVHASRGSVVGDADKLRSSFGGQICPPGEFWVEALEAFVEEFAVGGLVRLWQEVLDAALEAEREFLADLFAGVAETRDEVGVDLRLALFGCREGDV
jgi:hypothetical protein